MKGASLLFAFVFLFVSLLPVTSICQTFEQQQASTLTINQLYGNKFTFNPKLTRKANQKDVLELITENQQVSTAVQGDIREILLLDKPVPGFRAVIAEFEMECGNVEVMIMQGENGRGENTIVTLIIPPNNGCGKLLDSLAEYLYGGYISGDNGVKRCVSHTCPETGGYRGCITIISLVNADIFCYSYSDCSKEEGCFNSQKSSAIIFDTLFMTGGK